MAQTVFHRVEKKYILNISEYHILLEIMKQYMEKDIYDQYTICNIYYDTKDFSLIRTSIDKPIYKEKLRLRSYQTPTLKSNVFIEIKKKYQGIVSKRRVELPLETAYSYLEGRKKISTSQQIRELDYFLSFYKVFPVLYLAYDRICFQDKQNSNFRVTFDTNIRYRKERLRLEEGDEGKTLLPEGTILMEAKTLGSYPLWFVHYLSEYKIYPTSFSKYGNIYQQIIQKKEVMYV